MILLILAIAAIVFALKNKSPLFGDDKNNQEEVATPELTQAKPLKALQKMSVATENVEIQTASVLSSESKLELVETETELTNTSNALASQKKQPQEPITGSNNATPLQPIETPNQLQIPQSSTEPKTQETTEQRSSFSMTGSSRENNSNSLKQRIAESLDNNDVDLAQVLLNELLENEPDNIKARKKLASLNFAQGSYARTKQLLLQGIQRHPTKSDLRLMLARLYVIQKESSNALEILAGDQPNVDNQTEYLAYRAALAQQLKQTTLAKSDYQTLTNIESTNAKWWLGLAIAEDQLGDINMAVQAYSKASALGQLDDSVNDFIQQRISVLAGVQ